MTLAALVATTEVEPVQNVTDAPAVFARIRREMLAFAPTMIWASVEVPDRLIQASSEYWVSCAAVLVSDEVTMSFVPSKVTAELGSSVRRPAAPNVGPLVYVPFQCATDSSYATVDGMASPSRQ